MGQKGIFDSVKEIWVKQTRVFWGQDSIVYVDCIGEVDDDLAERIQEIFNRIVEAAEKNIKFILDLNGAGKPSLKARKMFTGFGKHKHVQKVAAYGVHPVARIIANFDIGKTGKNFRFFKTKEEALLWLNKEGPEHY